VIQHDLSRNLLQNSRTSNIQILSLTLRVVFNMFNSVREHMKVHLEVFFNSIHLAESSLPETREMALESLVEFCREPQLMVDIYTNYDCDMQCTNLFEDMVKFLSNNTFPLSGSLNALNLLSLEGLLAIVRSLADACRAHRSTPGGGGDAGSGEEDGGGDKTAEQLRIRKQHKRRVAMAAEHFNCKPTKPATLEYLQTAGFLPPVLDGDSIAHFLLETPGLDRTAIGEYLGDPDELPLATLKAYVSAFEFEGLPLSDALRKFLAAFRLPGESQKIARIVEHFAEAYFEQQPPDGPLANSDTVYILAYAIIMLNTDLHNAQVFRPRHTHACAQSRTGMTRRARA
jgi:brefeldin A-resistance guanine nucleotide exchange factor 1